ncbi:hypothetical protein Agub_g1012 [Astrephomene gubernaculifera]|uniref:Uncharacterized protein n=1 Tax=Astrephomene gubernaculifera TaxID=47775 RepID=A0AAD3DHD1_9CHLO|nr:hypothetical protein Agub_g1012 [Astrephomene gubernaculifera]
MATGVETVSPKTETMEDFDTSQLELITPHVTTQLQVFNSQVVAHLKNYKPEVTRIYGRIGDLVEQDERLEGQLKGLEATVSSNHARAEGQHSALSDRLAKVEQILSALPSWKEDLVNRIDNLARETRAKHEAAASRTTLLEDLVNGYIEASRERLDMLTTLARTASEARAQQQERLDELDVGLRRLRETTEKELMDHRLHLRRHDEQHVLSTSKLAEQGGLLGSHTLDLARLRDSSDQHSRQLENLARGADRLHDIAMGMGQEIDLVKRGMASTDNTVAVLEAKLASMDSEMGARLKALETHRNQLFEFRKETLAALERIDKEYETLTDRVQMLDAKVDAGPPGLWKMAAQVSAHEDELAAHRTALSAGKATSDELGRRLDDVLSGLSHQRDVAAQLREECRMLSDRVTSEASRAQQYVDDRLDPLARRYEVEALRRQLDSGLERLEAALAGSGERLKFELLHDEVAQVDSVRSYMAEVERRNAGLSERLAALEAGLAGEAERGRSVAAVTRELRGTMDGLLSTSQADLARLRATMSSLHEEYQEMSKKARRAGLLTVSQVEDMIEVRLNGPVMDAIISRKLSQLQTPFALAAAASGGHPGSQSLRSLPSGVVRYNPTSPAPRGGAPSPSWQPVSQLTRQASMARSASLGPGVPPGGEDDAEAGETGVPGVPAAAAQAAVGAAGAAGGAPGGAAAGAGAADPALGLRLVAVEADLSRLFEAFRALGQRVASSNSVADLRDEMRDLAAAVSHIQVGQGILGEAGEEAVRRHMHATLLPDLLRKQAHDSKRIMGWMDEQLSEVSRDISALRRTQEQLQQKLLMGAGGGGGGDGRSSPSNGNRHRGGASRPASASAAVAVGPLGMEDGEGADGGGDTTVLAERVQELAEQLAALTETLGLPLTRKAYTAFRGSRANSTSGRVTWSNGPELPTGAQSQEGGQDAAAAAGGCTTTGGDATDIDGLSFNLPPLVQRLQQLEAAVHSIAAGQQALAAAAAATHDVDGVAASADGKAKDAASEAAGSNGSKTVTVRTSPAASHSSPVAAAMAVQGLVDAAVADVRLRLKLLENEMPMLARNFELKALRRRLQDVASVAAVASATATAAAASAASAPMAAGRRVQYESPNVSSPGAIIASTLTAAAEAARAEVLPPRSRANGSSSGRLGSAGSSAGAVITDPNIIKRLASLELALATLDERGRALEERWSARDAKWGTSMTDSQGALPRLQSTVAQLAKEVQRLAAGGAAGSGQAGWARGGGGGGDDGNAGAGGDHRGGGGGRSPGVNAVSGGSFLSSHNPNAMGEVVNVELSGIAHDLSVAAHEELQRVRDGPLPDGTQDGLPTPAATAAREAALARLRRKPREVSAHVELLEAVKLHLDRLMRRSATSTTDRLVLLTAMGAMRVKLLENEAETFREQIIAVFRSLERAFQALVKLQEAVASKGSATAVGQLAAMLQDVSTGLTTLAAHAALRDTAPVSAAAAAGGGLPVPPALTPGGPLDEALQLLMPSRAPSPTAVIRPTSPVRLSGPGINTAVHRQQAAAARGAGGAAGGVSGGRLASAGPTASSQQAWYPPARATSASGSSPPPYKATSGNLAAAAPSGSRSISGGAPTVTIAAAAAAAGGGPPGGGVGPEATGPPSPSALNNSEPLSPRNGASTSGRMWSGRRPGSAVVHGMHVAYGAPGAVGAVSRPLGPAPVSVSSSSGVPGALPSIAPAGSPRVR